MEFLVTYDVTTETDEGQRRLRRVANVCEAFGQRVQKSVFECALDALDLERLKARLLSEIEPSEDSLRIYRLREPRSKYLLSLGKDLMNDLHDPLVL